MRVCDLHDEAYVVFDTRGGRCPICDQLKADSAEIAELKQEVKNLQSELDEPRGDDA